MSIKPPPEKKLAELVLKIFDKKVVWDESWEDDLLEARKLAVEIFKESNN